MFWGRVQNNVTLATRVDIVIKSSHFQKAGLVL